MFSAEATSHEFRLNIIRDIVALYEITVIYMGVAILTGDQCRQKCLYGCTWLIQSQVDWTGGTGTRSACCLNKSPINWISFR